MAISLNIVIIITIFRAKSRLKFMVYLFISKSGDLHSYKVSGIQVPEGVVVVVMC